MRWQLALAQHPMYLIIREDTICAERTPPWGAPGVEEYNERLHEALVTLRRYPQLRLGFEWSGYELELLAEHAPAVFQEMGALVREGRVCYYNGTYAQPHLQTLSSEANWRQFEYGLRVYRELCGQQVLTYQHQEASVHDQVPQLLRAFGLRYGVTPSFLYTLQVLEPIEVHYQVGHGRGPLHLLAGAECLTWRGLDGTELPLYVNQDGHRKKEDILGMLHLPPLAVDSPDMVAVDDAWMERHGGCDYVLLDQALPERFAQVPYRPRARHYANWSYIEGIRAEELSRANWRAEQAALRAESIGVMAFALLGRPAEATESIWKTILGSQHHDVYCFSAPELKDKAIHWLQRAAADAERLAGAAARAICRQVASVGQAGQPVVVLNTVPHAQKELVSVPAALPDPVVVDAHGHALPAESVSLADGGAQVRFLAELPGWGYATYWLRDGGKRTTEDVLNAPLTFENGFYRAIVASDGTFHSLQTRPEGHELLDAAGAFRGNHLAAMDSTGLSPRREGPAMLDRSTLDWQPPRPGVELHWRATAPAKVRRSPLGVTLVASGMLGARVRVERSIAFYHDLPRIDLTYDLSFDEASIGTFYDDESKLRVLWPLAFAGAIQHDIAFGAVQEWESRPFFPVSWTDISDGQKGLACFHTGTPKHWVQGRVLANLLAWGEDTDAIGNRLDDKRWFKSFDQRLRGRHVIQSAILPHAGDWRAADMIAAAHSFAMPPTAYLEEPHSGTLPGNLNLLTLLDKGLAATALRAEDGQVRCRVYAALGDPATAAARTQRLAVAGLRTACGEAVQTLQPFQIGELGLIPAK